MLIPRRTVRTSQPQQRCTIDWSNPITVGLLDAWLPQSMAVTSVLGRKPTSTAPLSFVQTVHGVGASATSGSIRYDVGEWAESGPHAFLIIADILSFSGTRSFARKDGAISPAQIANSTLRGVPWSPANGGLNYYSSPSAPKHGVYVANRPSLANYDNWVDCEKVSSTTALTGYGSTSNPLCFLGTETSGELVTSSIGRMFLSAIWSRGLTDKEICSLSSNPWQIFEDEEEYRFIPAAGGGGSVSLVVADSSHGHVADSPVFSMATYLAVAESLHAHAADNLTLSATGAANLVVQESTHAHLADGIALTTNWLLFIADALHSHAADNLSLDASNATFLTIQDALHSHAADNLGLSLDTWLAIVDAAHAHAADAPTLSASVALLIAEALHAHYADVAVLSLPGETTLTPEDITAIAAAVLAAINATTIPVNMVETNGEAIIGNGTEGNKFRSHLVG